MICLIKLRVGSNSVSVNTDTVKYVSDDDDHVTIIHFKDHTSMVIPLPITWVTAILNNKEPKPVRTVDVDETELFELSEIKIRIYDKIRKYKNIRELTNDLKTVKKILNTSEFVELLGTLNTYRYVERKI